jgi:hypothetical protein
MDGHIRPEQARRICARSDASIYPVSQCSVDADPDDNFNRRLNIFKAHDAGRVAYRRQVQRI